LQALQAKEAAETEALNQKANEEREKLHQVDDELRKVDSELTELNRQIKEKEIEIEHLGGHVEEIVRKNILLLILIGRPTRIWSEVKRLLFKR
jgi:SMC interacting uncharacterized protein involved in chromosome segregation